MASICKCSICISSPEPGAGRRISASGLNSPRILGAPSPPKPRSGCCSVRSAKGELLGAMSLAVSTKRMSRDDVVNKLLPELEVARRTFAMQL